MCGEMNEKIAKTKSRLRNGTFLRDLVVAICAIASVMSAFGIYFNIKQKEIMKKQMCGYNLIKIGRALDFYASHNENKFPAPDNWCDLLIKETEITKENFICPEAKRNGNKASCHYAMNPNCQPDSPDDVVLLFETKGGWNQHGGPELLTIENHKSKGCFVLFNDGYVDFFKPEDVNSLKWAAEEPNKKSTE
jgi:hypothetical protein